jgi:hypothetical protein
MAAYNTAWGKCITELLERHGLSLRSARAKTLGVVSHTTISDWRDGLLPKDDRLALGFLSHFPREEAIECLRAGNIPIPDEWLGNTYQITIDVPEIGRLVIQSLKPELTDEQQQEVIRVVKEVLAKQPPQ